MIIVQEKQQLDEMSRLVVSNSSDNLPFRIVVNSPDHQPPHAHVLDKQTGKKELGQFKISPVAPKRPVDIEDYKQGVTDEMRGYIFKWAGSANKSPFLKGSNWQSLNYIWSLNEVK
jgi:hypothetical protein